ncbi:zinc finger CCCH domain-containing protein 46-like isoform X2 [Primulina eburnea]|uniref:zinc finger CCCH domain-containing protein 46-like isoform X2 n=1 Tax=Primulina eburnea TaxID=1245227 RepID=UPI003C6C437A
MDTSEATKVLMSRIQSLDPENATKIIGVILIQDEGEKDIIRLAQTSDTVLLSCINHVKICLGISPSCHSSDASNAIWPKNPFSLSSSRISIPSDGFHLSNPSSPAGAFPSISPRPVSYTSAMNDAYSSGDCFSGSSSLSLYGDELGEEMFSSGGGRVRVHPKVHEQNDSMVDPRISPSGRSDSLILPYTEDFNSSIISPHSNPFHRRSCSGNDDSFLVNPDEEGAGSGFGWTPCMYYARGFCKNGSYCKFLHSVSGGAEGIDVGSPRPNSSGLDEFLRMKAIQQQRFALMASVGHYPNGCSKRGNFLNENQRSATAALMMGDSFQKINPYLPERNDSFSMGLSSIAHLSSRQIYLTFPADCTFKEGDVSVYFCNFGPVQDVRIPYQQKRMFGFVTFAFPETVKLILAKGNPHFVCGSRVLVKPYIEKGMFPDKKHQNIELGEYAASLSPTELDLREHLDIPFGPRMLLNSQEMMLRRKMEKEAELQHAVELQGKRMMNLRLTDLKNQPQMHNFFPVSSPRRTQLTNQNILVSSNAFDQQVPGDDDGGQEAAVSQAITADDLKLTGGTKLAINNDLEGANNQEHVDEDESDISESLEYTLPDNLFASPTKFSSEN